MILRFFSRLLYLLAITSWLAAAAPQVEALSFRYEGLAQLSGPQVWVALWLSGAVLATCGATLGALASIRSDCQQIKILLTTRS